MRQWVCTILTIDRKRYGIILYAVDADDIEDAWPWVTVEGELIGTA